tara:strand:+ start:14 stop:682 length:669 start_codon:yes stop_codon:yes gene_type:complete
MKTNFLYFREHGLHTTTVSGAYGGNQDFTLLDDSGSNTEFAFDISADTEVKVEVTFKDAQTTKCGSAYSGGAVDAGETIEINATGKSLETGGIIRIAKQTADNTNGVTLSTGDIVTISLIPTEGTEACFRADRFLAIVSVSDTSTVLTFKASNGSAADDVVTLTHPDNDGAEFLILAKYINEVCNANITERGRVITVWDKQNRVIGTGLEKAGVTNMELTIA